MGYLINAIKHNINVQSKEISKAPKGASYEVLSSLMIDDNVIRAALCRANESSLPEGSDERYQEGSAAARYQWEATRVGALKYKRHHNDGLRELTRVCASKSVLIDALYERIMG